MRAVRDQSRPPFERQVEEYLPRRTQSRIDQTTTSEGEYKAAAALLDGLFEHPYLSMQTSERVLTDMNVRHSPR